MEDLWRIYGGFMIDLWRIYWCCLLRIVYCPGGSSTLLFVWTYMNLIFCEFFVFPLFLKVPPSQVAAEPGPQTCHSCPSRLFFVLEDLWKIYEGFMEDLWWIHGRFMADLWRFYGQVFRILMFEFRMPPKTIENQWKNMNTKEKQQKHQRKPMNKNNDN